MRDAGEENASGPGARYSGGMRERVLSPSSLELPTMSSMTPSVEAAANELFLAVPKAFKGHVRRLAEEIKALRGNCDSLGRAVEEVESTLHAMRDGEGEGAA